MSRKKQRVQPDYDALGYAAATVARNLGIGGTSWSTGDWHTYTDRETLVEMSRQMARDNAIFAAAKSRLADNILGPDGFTLQSRVKPPRTSTGRVYENARAEADKINRTIEDELWPRFAEDPEARGLYTFPELSRVIVEEMVEAGDLGAIKLSTGKLQVVESEQIGAEGRQSGPDGKRIEQGIELDDKGRPVRFWVRPAGQHTYKSAKPFKADNFLYIHGGSRRITQTRPVPPFSPTLANIHRLNDILTAEAVAWQMLSRFAVAINRDGATLDAYEASDGTEDVAGAARDAYFDTDAEALTDRVVQTEMGTMFWGAPGESVQGVKHDIPSANFAESVTAYLRLIGMQIGLPLEILMLDWSKTNFSSARAAIEQAKLTLHRWQRLVETQFHARVYRWKIREWIDAGELPDRPDIFDHEWIAHPMPWIDIEKEAKAQEKLLALGMTTYDESLKARGRERSSENEKRDRTIRDAITLAKDIETDTGVSVPWEYFAGYMPGKTEMAVRAGADGTKSDGETDDNEE